MAPPVTDRSVAFTPEINASASDRSLDVAACDALMKEEDADVLARGVGDSCSSGQTPLFKPIALNHPSTVDILPMITPAVCNGDEDGVFRRKTEEFSNTSCSLSPNHAVPVAALPSVNEGQSTSSSTQLLSGDSLSLRDESDNGDYKYRRCLSGDVRIQQGEDSSDRVNTNPASGEDSCEVISPISVADGIQQPAPLSPSEDARGADSTESRILRKSSSFDRRLNEAMQFAEAVGEMPPLNQHDIQVIVEETESDYNDDSSDEVEIHHTQPPAIPGEIDISERTILQVTNLAGESNSENDDHSGSHPIHKRQKSRPQWPFQQDIQPPAHSFLHKLPNEVGHTDFVYKGIKSNPPEITKRGISRGNYAQLHRKAWLEVSDKYHRYGKNLRLYYRLWESRGFPNGHFFDWLDSKGEAAGQPLPTLDDCPRSQLDSDTVLYITNPEVTDGYELTIEPDSRGVGRVCDVDNDPVRTGPEGWIFVLRDRTLYGAEKITSVTGQRKQRFHHSSFFGGKAVAGAGILITDDEGFLTRLYPHSGHYRPGEADMQRMLFYLHHNGIDLRTFDMDMQQLLHVTRDEGDKKKRKTHSLQLKPAVYVASFLAHKARLIQKGVFSQIHTIRKANVTTVMEALEECDDGGYWAKVWREFGQQKKPIE